MSRCKDCGAIYSGATADAGICGNCEADRRNTGWRFSRDAKIFPYEGDMLSLIDIVERFKADTYAQGHAEGYVAGAAEQAGRVVEMPRCKDCLYSMRGSSRDWCNLAGCQTDLYEYGPPPSWCPLRSEPVTLRVAR